MKKIITMGLMSALTLSALAQDTAEKPQRPQRPDPATVANKMVTDFDKDGNSTLNKQELGAAMQAMREQRGPGGPAARPRQEQGVGPRQQQGERPQMQRPRVPQAEGRGPVGERPDRGDPTEMFLKRNDSNEDGELSAAELAAGLGQMNRGREQPNRDRPRGEK